ncbi:MAG: tetratricopeptide repeat protein [Chitinophagaceae bacterium]|jgi:tetratricopeptide (TPR) repeat protein|nr:tetratricopeptide repeat protein [Chitinophagaceae bacterium]
MKGFAMTICIACVTTTVLAQDVDKELSLGNRLYKEGQFDKAADQFDRAILLAPRNTIASYNLGNTHYRNNKPAEAEKAFDLAISQGRDARATADAWYNKGVVLSSQKKIDESIEAYKQALRLNPTDSFARENLVRALREQQKKKEQEQEQQKKKKQEEKEKQQPKMNKQQVQQLLQALQEQEKQLQQKMQKMKVPSPGQPEKDW